MPAGRRGAGPWCAQSGGSVPSEHRLLSARRAGLSNQLLMLFTRNFCPGTAEIEEPSVRAAVTPLSQPAGPSSPRAVPRRGLWSGSLKPCAHGLLTHPGIDLSCIQTRHFGCACWGTGSERLLSHLGAQHDSVCGADGLQGKRVPVPANSGFWNR